MVFYVLLVLNLIGYLFVYFTAPSIDSVAYATYLVQVNSLTTNFIVLMSASVIYDKISK